MSETTYDLNRFLVAQEDVYIRALQELRAGEKYTHWMWFIFPQVTGLGYSSTAQYYALKSHEEAQAYLVHQILGSRLQESTAAVMALEDRSALDIFGGIDELKFHSSMTLFAHIAAPESVYREALDNYFDGKQDYRTLEILDRM
jgi:uncharacterized protein (DUF1810 family)